MPQLTTSVQVELFLAALWALALCALGYPLLRLHLLVAAVVVGAYAGGLAAAWYLAPATGVDYLVACGGGTILLGLLSWFLYRLVAGLYMGGFALAVLMVTMGMPQSTGGWVAYGAAVLVVVVLGAIFAKPLSIACTALGGAGAAVCSIALLLTGDGSPESWRNRPEPSLAVTIACIVLAVLLAAGGTWVQTKLLKKLRTAFAAPDAKTKGAKASSKPRPLPAKV